MNMVHRASPIAWCNPVDFITTPGLFIVKHLLNDLWCYKPLLVVYEPSLLRLTSKAFGRSPAVVKCRCNPNP